MNEVCVSALAIPPSWSGLLEVSAGTEQLFDAACGEHIFVPRGPWRELTHDEIQRWVSPKPKAAACVSLLHLAGGPGSQGNIDASYLEVHASELAQRPRLAGIQGGLSALVAFQGWLLCSELEDAPGLETVSFDPTSGGRVGLHIDAWPPGHLLAQRERVHRLDVNLGNESRGFVFLPITVAGMAEMLGDRFGLARRLIGRAFLARYPDYPALRLRVPPGSAYLAPVDDILHDGCSSLSAAASRHLAIEGDVRIRAEAIA